MRTWWLAILLLLSFCLTESLAWADRIDEGIELLKVHAEVDWHQVSAPLGRVLLIRKGKDICGIRFTEFHRGRDAKPPSVFNSGEESFYAEYDWFCQADGSYNLKKSNITKGHKKLVEKPLRGFGRLAFQTGNVEVKCGPFKLFWMFPTSVSFYSSSSPMCSDASVELSPTKWRQIEEVDISYSGLKWFGCDEQRKTTYISLDEL